MARLDSKQHLKIRAGMVASLTMSGRARILPKRSEPRWGEQAVLREARLDSRLTYFADYSLKN
jgi:hypothetical protein